MKPVGLGLLSLLPAYVAIGGEVFWGQRKVVCLVTVCLVMRLHLSSLLEQKYIFLHNTFRNQLVRGLPVRMEVLLAVLRVWETPFNNISVRRQEGGMYCSLLLCLCLLLRCVWVRLVHWWMSIWTILPFFKSLWTTGCNRFAFSVNHSQLKCGLFLC